MKEKDQQVQDLQKKFKGADELKRICGVQQDKLEEQEQRLNDGAKEY